MKKILSIILLLCLSIPVYATTYYIRNGGTVGGAGTSWATAIDNPTTFVAKASSGDIGLISNGVYFLNTVAAAGAKYLTMQGYSDSGIYNVLINGATNKVVSGFSTSTGGFSLYNLTFTAFSNGTYGATALFGPSNWVQSCIFSNNQNVSSTGSGVGVYISSTTGNNTITNCTFINNIARNAAAIYLVNTTNIVIYGCSFIQNTGTVVGAAVENVSSTPCTVLVNSNIFIGNVGSHPGFCDRTLATTPPISEIITNCIFQANWNITPFTLTAGAGGICDIYGGSSVSTATVANCVFNSNTGFSSSATIYSTTPSDMYVNNCSFISNVAQGASANIVYLDSLSINYCGFTNNSSSSSGNTTGGIFNDAGFPLLVNNCSFVSNSAYQAGAMNIKDGIISNCYFYANLATNGHGGAINRAAGSSIFVVAGCTFNTNVVNAALKLGPAIIIATGTTNLIYNCSFNGNSNALYQCGGIYGYAMIISNCTFSSNWASNTAAAISINAYAAYPSQVIGCTFLNNFSGTGNGGVIVNNGVGCLISNCSFVGNIGSNTCTGGVIYWTPTLGGRITQCHFTNNVANGGGAVAYIDSGNDLLIDNCDFVKNKSYGLSGGTLYFKDGTLSNCLFAGNYNATIAALDMLSGTRSNLVYGCIFSNNSSSSGAALVTIEPFPVLVQNCTIIGNNVAAGHSSGISIESSGNTIRNCLVAGNTGASCAGIMLYSGTNNLIDSCTVVQNYASVAGNGSGIILYGVGKNYITNTISWQNYSSSGPVITNDNLAFKVAGTTGYVDHCCVYTNVSTLGAGYLNLQFISSITNDPKFVNIGSSYGTNLLNSTYDFTLQNISPCYQTGIPELWMNMQIDLWGNVYNLYPPNIGVSQNSYFSSRKYSQSIKFSGYTMNEILTNFPVLVVFTNFSTMLYPYSGQDLRFWSTPSLNGTPLNFEIDTWGITQALVWVQVPLLNSNTTIYASWGDPADYQIAPSTTNGATWDSNYVGVWHLSVPPIIDSTSNGLVTTAFNALQTAVVGNGAVITNNQIVSAASNSVLTVRSNGEVSVEAWVFTTTTNAVQSLASKRANGATGWGIEFFVSGTQMRIYHFGNVAGSWAPSVVPTISAWNFMSVVASTSSNLVFKNGTLAAQQAGAGICEDVGQPLTWGRSGVSGSGDNFFTGVFDELRYSYSARSANWIWAEYQNIASNSVFQSYGPVTQVVTVSAGTIFWGLMKQFNGNSQ